MTAYMRSRLSPAALGTDGHIVLLASPNRLTSVTQGFSHALGLGSKGQKLFEQRLCHRIGAPWLTRSEPPVASITRPEIDIPFAYSHDKDVPFRQ